MLRLWPDPTAEPLQDPDLVRLYNPADRARPWLRANFVTSVDGAASLAGYSAGLSGPADKRVFGLLRMLCDALLVGAGTLREEGYRALRLSAERRAWRLAHGLTEYPVLVVVSGRLLLDPAQAAFADAPVRPIVITTGTALAAAPAAATAALAAVAAVRAHGERVVDLPAALADLHGRGLRQVLCEGGPSLLGAITAADLLDELCLTVSPLLAGPGAARITAGPPVIEPRGLALRHVLHADGMLLTRYTRPAPPA